MSHSSRSPRPLASMPVGSLGVMEGLWIPSAEHGPRIAWLDLEGQGAPRHLAVRQFRDLATLLQAEPLDVVVIDGAADAVAQALLRLRADDEYGQALIYLHREADGWGEALSDGLLPADPSAIHITWQRWQQRQHQFRPAPGLELLETKLLHWLWLRPQAWIRPVRDPGCANYYRYPLVEAFADAPQLNGLHWLEKSQIRMQLEAGELINRIRQCQACRSSHLNYIDICPECRGLDIARQPSLHCFVCGHVGPQHKFLRDQTLLCPNCLTQLRHIGSDYDRPIENYSCRSCHAFFVDAKVEAHCIDCSHTSSPEKLHVGEIRSYRLSSSSRLSCRNGHHNSLLANNPTESTPLLREGEFLRALNWQISIARRSKHSHTANVATVLGIHVEMPMLDRLIERLGESLHDSDRCMHSDDGLIWLLLPQTDHQALRDLEQQLADWFKNLQTDKREQQALEFGACVLPDQLNENDDAELLLKRLSAAIA